MAVKRDLYDEAFEHDGCGIGLVARADGRPDHDVVERGLELLGHLSHRGAIGSDAKTGDGAGIMTQIPRDFFGACPDLKGKFPSDTYAVGVVFGHRDRRAADLWRSDLERQADLLDLSVVAWRDVPVREEWLGAQADASRPAIRQFFVVDRNSREGREEALYQLRKAMQVRFPEQAIISLSFSTVVYKALVLPERLADFYPDLNDPLFASAFVLAHSRFSTNTLPSWPLAHPFRFICHNGEINTIRGNRAWMAARAEALTPGLSDSASVDEAVEKLVRSGRSLPEAIMTMVPQAWESDPDLPDELRAFYDYQSERVEPWDGPAAICFADGRCVGAALDRSGFRPCRYMILRDGTLVLASEAGALRVPSAEVVKRGRLGPAQMILVDFESQRILFDMDIKSRVAGARDYAALIASERAELAEPTGESTDGTGSFSGSSAGFFGVTSEEMRMVLEPMFRSGEEPTSSMGNDAPLAVLSDLPQPLPRYFRQLFAQVTNPPIDPLREGLVMTLATFLGPRGAHGDGSRSVRLDQPVLTPAQLRSLRDLNRVGGVPSLTLDITFPYRDGEAGFLAALADLELKAVEAVRSCHVGALLLSDRGAGADRVTLPALLAVAAVHRALFQAGLRLQTSIAVDTAQARDVHHIACLIGYGADAVHPWLVFSLAEETSEPARAQENLVSALGKGLLTIMSKMGISSLRSYCGAEVFEIIGLARDVVSRYFPATPSRVGGLDLRAIAHESMLAHARAVAELKRAPGTVFLSAVGEIHYRHGGEIHQWNPSTIAKLQVATRNNDIETYRSFAAECERLARFTLRGLLHFRRGTPVPLDEVESAANLVKRFTTGAMSFGSLSQEAHETLAIAMNRMGAKSNSGEGGESAERFRADANGDSRNSAIKQVASGRFGVTAHYLVNARELQIKMAQGAKPGEGGKLPGFKVDAQIARLRNSTPGVTLISPPPHHDIYSIEDLAQLIFDLKRVNDRAAVSVKLVATAGIGTIASGVAKARADKILVSGDSGGTGASPLSSIKSAGSPWEIGLAEVQQTLVRQGLRSRVRVEADGQMKTGRDVAIAALLGAEEFGFSTAPLIVEGCVMMRKCHLNTCPVGVATQDPELRRKFTGVPEHVVNYFFFVAEELRGIMASLGVRRLEHMIGRPDYLEFGVPAETLPWKTRGLDLSALLALPECQIPGVPTERRYCETAAADARSLLTQTTGGARESLDMAIEAACEPALRDGKSVSAEFAIHNTDRATGAHLSGQIARIYGADGLTDDAIQLRFAGTAGQSFGAFLAGGVTLRLSGDANDYVGKGLSGGRLIVAPGWSMDVKGSADVVAGNACLYGATSGDAWIAGVAGERFAVRNSGATAVVEGVGDHGCEYMTGGMVIVLGPTGRNFAAGMSGGIAYVFDDRDQLGRKINGDGLEVSAFLASRDEDLLKTLIGRHVSLTGSERARAILRDWRVVAPRFVRVMPLEYKNALAKSRAQRGSGGEIGTGVLFNV